MQTFEERAFEVEETGAKAWREECVWHVQGAARRPVCLEQKE